MFNEPGAVGVTGLGTTASVSSVMERMRALWRGLTRSSVSRALQAVAPDRDQLLQQLYAMLRAHRSEHSDESSARERAERTAAWYLASDLGARAEILETISRTLTPDREALSEAITAMREASDDTTLSRAESRLRLALAAPRARFLAEFNLLPNGVKFVVDLRADLLKLLPEHPSLEVLQIELNNLLTVWFDPGFLRLQRISWQSPAEVLEKLIAYEAVQPIDSWNDLRNRLDTDRRCYAFFHPRMPSEPLIFVELALLRGFPESVQQLLDLEAPVVDPLQADTAVFYSISNTQDGLRGISFGNRLLKDVIADLMRELPQLKVFATLSPLPHFRKWLERGLGEGADGAELARLRAAVYANGGASAISAARGDNAAKNGEALRNALERLCAHYLLRAKAGKRPLDPVAAFHLANGARINRVLWRADISERGVQQSYGMMVSYRYEPGDLDRNHERFSRDGTIAAASRVRRLLG